MAITSRHLTLDEFLALPEESPGLEYLGGKVVRKVSPKAYHGSIQATFVETCNAYGRPRRLALAFPETRSTFGEWSPVPDVGVFRWATIPRRPDGKILSDFRTPWDIAVEIVSPEQRRSEIEGKCRWYCANGVEIALLIDPDREDVVRFGADGSRTDVQGEERIDLDSVLPGFDLTPAALFSALYPD